jgi:SulP family sulfate permease
MVMENNRLKQQGGGLYFVGLKSSVYEFAAKTCFVQRIGNDHFFDSKTAAIRYIYPRLDKEICKKCPSQIFEECQ